MTRLAIGIVIGLGVGVVVAAAIGIHAQSVLPEETVSAAADAGVDAIDLQGALNTLADAGIPTDPRSYLIADGALSPPSPPPPARSCGWPICGPLGQRIFCIEAIESAHGRAMWNPVGLWYGNHVEHAQGWLGWMPSTAAAWGAQIGNRASEWAAAARLIAAGGGSAFFGIATGRC